MKISIFQGVLIGIFVAGAGFGLFAFATFNGKGGDAAGIGKVVIWGTLAKHDIDTAFNLIGQTDNRIKSISYIQKDPKTLPTELASAIATGASPDLLLTSQEELQALTQFITPVPSATLPANVFNSAFIDEGKLLAVPGGVGYYGVPYLVDPLVLFWNNDILSSNGIAKPPAVWDALMGLVPNLALISPTKQISRGLIALGTYDNIHNARGIVSAVLLQAGVPISSRTSYGGVEADFGQAPQGGVPPAESALGFYTVFADSSKISYTWNGSLPDSQKMFQTGDLALYLGYASEARFFTAANPNLNFNVATFPQPTKATTKGTYGLLHSFMLSKASKNPTGAYKAAVFLTTTEAQTIAAAETGLAPAARTALAIPPTDPAAAVAYQSALYAKGWLSPMPASVDQVFSSMINDVITGRSGLSAALSRASGSLTILLQK